MTEVWLVVSAVDGAPDGENRDLFTSRDTAKRFVEKAMLGHEWTIQPWRDEADESTALAVRTSPLWPSIQHGIRYYIRRMTVLDDAAVDSYQSDSGNSTVI